MRYRVPFDWTFVQCAPEQLSEPAYRGFLTGAIFDYPQPFFEAKIALNVIAYRLLPEQAYWSIRDGTLLVIADIMQAGRSILHAGDFMRLKEHLFGIPQINALFISSSINSEMIEQGIDSIIPWGFISFSFDFQGYNPFSMSPWI
jgi:urease gamma subunit